MPKLTRRRQQILEYLQYYIARYKFPPTYKEIASGVGLSSASGIKKHLDALQELGELTHDYGCTRSIRLKSPSPESLPSVLIEIARAAHRIGASEAELVVAYRHTGKEAC